MNLVESIKELMGDYFWIIGLSLVVVGLTKIFVSPFGIFYAGVILFLIGVIIKGFQKDNLEEINKKLDKLLGIEKKMESQNKNMNKIAKNTTEKKWKKIEKKKWFQLFKENPLNLKIEDRIELVKFYFEKDLKIPLWFLGIGITIFLSINLSGITSLKEGFFYTSGIISYILTPILFLAGIILLIKNVKRQKIQMSYLYQTKSNKKKK